MKQPDSRLIPDSQTGKPLYGVGAGTLGAFLDAYYPEAQKLIRVATGYLRLEGYKLGRSYLHPHQTSVQFHILVGPKEGEKAQLAVRDEIRAELDKGKKIGYYTPLVREVIRRIKAKEFVIYDAREMTEAYHCKFYICDQTVLCHGSGNYTVYGILKQHEQIEASRNPAVIIESSDWFDEASKTAKDVTRPILKVLEDWLKLAPPFHAYLKFLMAFDILFDRGNIPGLHLPVYYQQWIITRALEDCKQHRAAIILAATGLGKTIIGAELAFLLKHLNMIDDVILIAPSAVHADWKKHLKVRGIHDEFFSNSLLFVSPSDSAYSKVFKLDERLSEATDRTLIIIDESHIYRNQDRADWQKHHKQYRTEAEREKMRGGVVLDRIRPLVENRKALIVLLTATPYGTNPGNVESLLRFLPEVLSKPDQDTTQKRKTPTLNELARLPFVSSLGLRQVLTLAKERGDTADNRVFVSFGSQPHFMPEKVYLRRVGYELPFFEKLCTAYDANLFAQSKLKITDKYDEGQANYVPRGVDAANSQFITAWLSSPPAIAECLTNNLQTLGKRDAPDSATTTPGFLMKEDSKVRKRQLDPIQKKLARLKKDDKVQQLLALLETHVTENREKVIVFVERHVTAVFIAEFLQMAKPTIAVGCMVTRQREGGCSLKDPDKRSEILDNFSPKSRGTKKITFSVDVLICTDANGIGVNLQDANVVINYDPADSADILFQRAGRVIRFTADLNRKIYIYTFEPELHNSSSDACKKIASVFDNMGKHHNKSKTTFGLSILPENDEDIIDLNNPEQETTFMDSFNMVEDSSLHDPLSRHTAILDKHRTLAATLTDSLYSSKVYKGKESRIAVLIEQATQKHIILYNLRSRKFEFENDPVSIIDLIACQDQTDNAPIDMGTVERSTKRAVSEWQKKLENSSDEIRILCGCYLAPKWKKTFSQEMLRKFVQRRKKHEDKKRK